MVELLRMTADAMAAKKAYGLAPRRTDGPTLAAVVG
jgi:hypothetical protein